MKDTIFFQAAKFTWGAKFNCGCNIKLGRKLCKAEGAFSVS